MRPCSSLPGFGAAAPVKVSGVRVVVIGATGNVGTSLLPALAAEPAVDSVLAVARRLPELAIAKTDWARADVTSDDIVPLLRGADAVVHLAWAIQPSHDPNELWATNVHGSERIFRAVAEAGVPALVYASSVGAYSRGPKDRRVDENWPTDGVPTSFYARHKSEVERRLDRFERDLPDRRVVRLRPGLTFKHEAATGIRRLFAGPFLPSPLVRPGRVPFVPDIPGMRFQAVHSGDVADAYRRAIIGDSRGAFNIAAEPVLDAPLLAQALGARRVGMSARLARRLLAVSWRLHLQPTTPGWLDMALAVPLMDTARAGEELGWRPRVRADDALRELLAAISEGAGAETPPLAPKTSGLLRVRELLTGVGRSSGE
jgi:UDP-glucose 4-epimerase